MATLTEEQIRQLRDAMEQRRVTLLGEIAEVRARAEQPARDFASVPDSGDASTTDLLADVDHAAEERDVEELRDIDTAMQRMDTGSYGTCIDCEDDIPFERLVAFPTATRCILCAERREKTYAGGATPSL